MCNCEFELRRVNFGLENVKRFKSFVDVLLSAQ